MQEQRKRTQALAVAVKTDRERHRINSAPISLNLVGGGSDHGSLFPRQALHRGHFEKWDDMLCTRN